MASLFLPSSQSPALPESPRPAFSKAELLPAWRQTASYRLRLPLSETGLLGMRGSLQIREISLAVAGLEAGLAGLRLAHLSDWHVDFNTVPWLAAAIDALNDSKPDLVLLTGDFLTKGARWLPELKLLLERIQCPHLYACLGNHDYMDGHKGHRLRSTLESAGVTLLVNDRAIFHRQWGALQIAGVDDWTKGRPRARFLQRQLNPTLPTVLLCHNPAQFEHELQWPGVVLALCGHTHGGQFGLPDWIMRPVVGTRYVKGIHQVGSTVVSVSNGLGTASLTLGKRWYRLNIPMPRFNTPPELTLWSLQPTLPAVVGVR